MAKKGLGISALERLFIVFNYCIMTLFALICIYPFYYMLIYSLSDPSQVARGVYFFPLGFDASSYTNLLKQDDLINAYFISVARTVCGTLICIFSTSLLAYLVTKKQMFLRKFVYRYVIITMYMNAGLIPWYVTLKSYGLKDSFLLYILPGAVNAFYMILVKTYIEQLPASLEESAEIDGAGFFTVYMRIILPLCKPIIATIAVYAAVGNWNAWMDNYFLVRSAKLQTLQVILYKYLKDAQSLADSMRTGNTLADTPMETTALTPENIRMTITIMSVVPIMAVYPFLQKYFIKGIMIGAIKG